MRAQERECTRLMIWGAFMELVHPGTDREWLGERIQCSRTSTPVPLPPWVFNLSRTVKAVHALPSLLNHWVRFAYLPTTVDEWQHEAVVARAVWAEFEPTIGKPRAKTLKALKALAYLAQRDYRSRVNRQETYTVQRLAELAGVSEGNWYHDWQPRWRRLQGILQALDEKALDEVRRGQIRRPDLPPKNDAEKIRAFAL